MREIGGSGVGRGDGVRLRTAGEYEFITAEGAAAGGKSGQSEAAGAVEVEDSFGLGDFKGIAANPIDQVAPEGHAAVLTVSAPKVEGTQAEDILDGGAPI